ncbi:MAG: hypothetical protein IPH91_07330 [Elusimicrobia bacterium]|nr:hypothetical protein [Elusimicrobiota bacterium]
MTPFQKTAATALLLILGSGCDRFNDGLTGTPPAGATALTSFSGTYDLSHFPDVTVTFTLDTDLGPVDNLQLGNVAALTKEFDVEIDTATLTVTGTVSQGPDPVVITQLTKDPLIAGTYSLNFRTKTSGYWSFTLGFDYGGLKRTVDSFLNYQGSALPIAPPGASGAVHVTPASTNNGG